MLPPTVFLCLCLLSAHSKTAWLFGAGVCDIKEQSKMIYFIRHAQSKFNKVAQNLEKKYGAEGCPDAEEYTKEKFSHEYLDVEITEDGVEQCKGAREKMAEVDVDVVLVSPMRRALRTCSIIFEGHKSKAAVIVEPSFREIMESSNDVGSKIQESMQLFPSFDFSNIKDRQAWYVHTLHFEKDKLDILKKLQGLEGKQRSKAAIEETMKMMKENWFERRANLQQQEGLKERVLPDYPQQFKVLDHYFQKYDKIAVVAHSECIKRYAGYKIKNCQIFKMPRSQLPK